MASAGRFFRGLRRRWRGTPASARDLLPDYGEYLRLQREEFLSHEADVPAWAAGLTRFVRLTFDPLPRTTRILDCACGDGVGLEALRALGFGALAGVELAAEKARRARRLGFRVEERDMHDLSPFAAGDFDAILSSHTLEHAYAPGRVLEEFRRLLTPQGRLHVVLPYPDPGWRNERAHAAKYELGTHRDDGGEAVRGYFTDRGLRLRSWRLDAGREPEIWLDLEKVG